MENINQRKLEHIEIVADDGGADRRKNYFDQIRLCHRALPEHNLAAIDPSVQFMGKRLSFPLLISSMTGGADAELLRINQNLAAAAEAEGVALAVGSQRVLFSNPAARASFELRELAPTTLLFGNLGAVQLNEGMGVAEAKEAVRVLDADGLFLHLNPLQEAVQPEGDTQFAGLRDKIASVVSALEKPVVVKEVGAGISPQDVAELLGVGVKYIDVAGAGGTSWSRIEGQRCDDPALGDLFADWGIPTPLALKLLKPYRAELIVIASGGLRTGVDMAKSLILGASLCGMARPFLNPARESVEAVRVVIRRIKREFLTTLFLLGAGCAGDVIGKEELVLDENWN
jgi:isopentenyl-diphosphate delta-isomerase